MEESAEAVIQKCSVNKVLGKNVWNSQENICAWIEFQFLETCNFNHLLLYFVKFFKKAERGLKLVPQPHFQHDFSRKIFLKLTDQILLPDFEKLHKIHRKIPVKFLRTPLL